MKILINVLNGREIIPTSIIVRTIKEAREKIFQINNSKLYNGKRVVGKPLIT